MPAVGVQRGKWNGVGVLPPHGNGFWNSCQVPDLFVGGWIAKCGKVRNPMSAYADRVREALARGEECGTAVICPKHQRPMGDSETWFGINVCCPVPDQPAELDIHGIREALKELRVTAVPAWDGAGRTD